MKHLFLALLSISILTSVRAQSAGDFKRTEDVIYGRKFGTALTLDVFQPVKTNGCAVLFMVSGGFFSSHEAINAAFFKAFLDRGYTVFAIVHGSQPKFTIPEIIQDIQRAVRFISSPCEQIRRGRRPVWNYRSQRRRPSISDHGHSGRAWQSRREAIPIDRESSSVRSPGFFRRPIS